MISFKRTERLDAKTKITRPRIIVTIQAGTGDVCEDTVPEGIDVEILNFDNLEKDPKDEMSWWSPQLREYWLSNHKEWGRCNNDCPCRHLRRKKHA